MPSVRVGLGWVRNLSTTSDAESRSAPRVLYRLVEGAELYGILCGAPPQRCAEFELYAGDVAVAAGGEAGRKREMESRSRPRLWWDRSHAAGS